MGQVPEAALARLLHGRLALAGMAARRAHLGSLLQAGRAVSGLARSRARALQLLLQLRRAELVHV